MVGVLKKYRIQTRKQKAKSSQVKVLQKVKILVRKFCARRKAKSNRLGKAKEVLGIKSSKKVVDITSLNPKTMVCL